MADPLDDTDVHGLSSLARRWAPAGMMKTPEGRRLIEALSDQSAFATNILIDLEKYLPIIMNPTRCLDDDLVRILAMNGIDARLQTVSKSKMRRLAVLAASLRTWRGAFLSHRATVTALTGGEVLVRSYVAQRVIVDESSMNFIDIPVDQANVTDYFLLGQGPSGTDFDEPEVERFLEELAQPALDGEVLVDCFAVTAWKDGYDGWLGSDFDPSLVASSVANEYEALDLGPAVDNANAAQTLRTKTVKNTTTVGESEWVVAWFKTGSATKGDYWEIAAYTDENYTQGYVLRVPVGFANATIHRKYGSSYGSALATIPYDVSDDIDADEYHRIEMLVIQYSYWALIRVSIDGNPSYFYKDTVDFATGNRPQGVYSHIHLNTGTFTTGTLRVAAWTARSQNGDGSGRDLVALTLYQQMQLLSPWVLWNLYEWNALPAEIVDIPPREINTLYDMSGNNRDGETTSTNEPDVDTSPDVHVIAEPNPGDVLGGGNAAGTIETWIFNASKGPRYEETVASVTAFSMLVLQPGRRALNTLDQEFTLGSGSSNRFQFRADVTGGGRIIEFRPDGTGPNAVPSLTFRNCPRGYNSGSDPDVDRGNTYLGYIVSYKFDASGSYWRVMHFGDGGVNGIECFADSWWRDSWSAFAGPSTGITMPSDLRLGTLSTWSGGLTGLWLNGDAFDPEDRTSHIDVLKIATQYVKTDGEDLISSIFDNSPEDFDDLRSWWDFYDTGITEYDGSDDLVGIHDKGPDAKHLTPDQGSGVPGTDDTIDFKTKFRPGPVANTSPTSFPEASMSETLSGDFTVMCIIPTDFGAATAGSVYFSWQNSGTVKFSIRASSTAGEIEVADSGGRIAGIDAGFDASNNAGAVAILFVRRDAGGDLTLDCWYDDQQGGGIQKPSQVSLTDTLGSMTIDNVSIGGDGTGNEWADAGAKLDSIAWWDVLLTDAQVLLLAQWAGQRYQLSGVI